MKKVIKIILAIVISIVFVFSIFIAEESIRLKNEGQKPIIVLNKGGYCEGEKTEHTENSYTTNCKGLGYTFKRKYTLGGMTGDKSKGYVLIGEEFYLFGKFLIWGWIS